MGTVVTLGTATQGFGGNAPLWSGTRKVGEGRVFVVGWAGIGWLCVENSRPVVGAPQFVGPQYGQRGQMVPSVGEH